MILRPCKYLALGAALAGLAVPAFAEAPAAPTKPLASADARGMQPSHSRRVELPFPLDLRIPELAPRTMAPRENIAPHPFRETQMKRAALDSAKIGISPVRLSHPAQFG